MRCIPTLLLLLLTVLSIGSCRQKQETTSPAPEPSLIRATKTAYAIGDSITIQLNPSFSVDAVGWDNQPVQPTKISSGLLSFKPATKAVGYHQLVITGQTTTQKRVSDTLQIDVWSDVTPRLLSYTVLQTYPHQRSSFTQGLAFHNDVLYEGTGLNGQSKLMKVNLLTGGIIQSVGLPSQFFGEGITVVNDHVYQLTWTSGQCFQYTTDLVLQKTFVYHTQGWGITHRDTTLIVSDGSNRLTFYSLGFQKLGETVVYDNQGPVTNLNELEYVNGYVLANVWQTNRIVQIDPASGKVVGELRIDSNLPAGVNTTIDVLNGIAYRPGENALYITGKNWPSLFKIQVKELFEQGHRPKIVL
jgi:glutamine cyclotransferase